MTPRQAAYVVDGIINAASLLGQLQAERFAPTAEAVAGELEALLAAISFRVCQNAGGASGVLAALDGIRVDRERRGRPTREVVTYMDEDSVITIKVRL